MWFLYDEELDGFQTYETEKEAREELKNNIYYWNEEASNCGEYSDHVEHIMIGEVKEIGALEQVTDNENDGYKFFMKKS